MTDEDRKAFILATCDNLDRLIKRVRSGEVRLINYSQNVSADHHDGVTESYWFRKNPMEIRLTLDMPDFAEEEAEAYGKAILSWSPPAPDTK